jgi:hypothetical protein
MAIGAILTGVLAAAGGVMKTIQSNKDKRQRQSELDAYNRVPNRNAFEDLRVSTRGAVMQQEASAQRTASALYNLRRSGANAIFAGTGNVLKEDNQVNQFTGGNLDQMQTRNDELRAQGAMRVQDMKELREREDLAGLGNAVNVANHNMWGGVSDIVGGAGVLASEFGGSKSSDNSDLKDQIDSNRQETLQARLQRQEERKALRN